MKILRTVLFLTLALAACSPDEPPAPPAKPPDEAAALTALNEINRAQTDFLRRTRRYAQTFNELIADHLLTAEPTVETTGYDFYMLPSPDAASYTVKATPSQPETRHFFTDQTGKIRVETGKPAAPESPEI